MKKIMILGAMLLTLCGCAFGPVTMGLSTMEQEYVSENKTLRVKIHDTPVSHNIANTSAKYDNELTSSGQRVRVNISGERDADQTAQAGPIETGLNVGGAIGGAIIGGPVGAGVGSQAGKILEPVIGKGN